MADHDTSGETVALPDLEVVRRYSLAVRSATAPRAEVVQALEADLAWLTGGRSRKVDDGSPAPGRRRAAPAGESPSGRRRRRPPTATQ